MTSADSKTALPQVPSVDENAKQALRLRRFSMSVATYAACALLAQTCAWLGYLPPRLPLWWALGTGTVNAALYLTFRTGRNLRFRDPSLTEMQLVFSMLAVTVLVYFAGQARNTFLMLYPVPLLFGVFRLKIHQMTRVAASGIVMFAVAMWLLATSGREIVHFDLALLNIAALLGVMGYVCLLGAYISKVREQLSNSIRTIQVLAQRDPLTSLFNRRYFMEVLTHEVQCCERNLNHRVTVCLIDIDHFKRINDTYGHPVGDDVLIAVSDSIRKSVRAIDYVSRHGGEEFTVLLLENISESTLSICERIRQDISQLNIATIDDLQIFVSIGFAEWHPGDSAASLIARADRALYQAKAEGRNCVRMGAA